MSKKLTDNQAEVWDRLKNGIPPAEDDWESVEAIVIRQAAEDMAARIDEEMLKQLTKMYEDSFLS